MTTTTPKRVVLLLVPALLALVAASGEARGLEGPSPGAAVGTELAGPDVQGPELLGRSPSFFGASIRSIHARTCGALALMIAPGVGSVEHW